MSRLIKMFYAMLVTLGILLGIFIAAKERSPKHDLPPLNVFVWGDMMPIDLEKRFEKETGIKLQLHLFNTNEELLSKLRNTKGRGYDVLFASDYAIPILAEEGFIKPLHKERLSYYEDLDPLLLGHSYDPDNFYSIPFAWETVGFAFDSSVLPVSKTFSLDMLFPASPPPYKLLMTPDLVEAVNLASFALFGKKECLNQEEKELVQNLLKKQSLSIEAYSDYLRTKYLLTTKNSPLAVMRSPLYLDIAADNPDIRLALPKETTFVSIENIALASSCKNEKAAYTFIEFINRRDVLKDVMQRGPFFVARKDCPPYVDAHYHDKHQALLKEIHSRQDLTFFSYLISPREMQEVWLNAKTKD